MPGEEAGTVRTASSRRSPSGRPLSARICAQTVLAGLPPGLAHGQKRVGVQRDDAPLREVETGDGKRCFLAATQWGSDGNIGCFGGSVGVRDDGLRSTGEGDDAALAQRLVDPVEAVGGQSLAPQGVVGRQGGAFVGESDHRVVEAGEEFVGFQVQRGQGVDGGAQLAHRHGSLDAGTGYAADGEGGARAGEREEVEPAAAGIDRLVEMGALHGCQRLWALGKETALQGQGDGVFSGVAARIVDVQ